MAVRIDAIDVSLPGVRAVRWSTDELHADMKESYAVARVEVGRSEWWTRGTVWNVSPGTLLLQQPGDVHRDVSRDGPGQCQVVTFSADVVESAIGKVRVHPLLAPDDERGLSFRRLHAAVQAGAERFVLEVAVAEAIDAFATVDAAKREHTRPVRRASELLRERLVDAVTLDELAAHAGLDKFRLCRAFRAQVGLPPHAYLIRLRIMHAKQLLAAGLAPSAVASRVGFYDQSQLNRHFRRIVGTTPGQYARGI